MHTIRGYLTRPSTFIGLVLLLTAGIYLQTLSFDFVYDDFPLIVNNPEIRNFDGLPRIFTQATVIDDPDAGYFRPLRAMTFMIDYAVWGLNPLGYHLTNLISHVIVVGLLYVLVLRVLGSHSAALAASLFFGIHPVNTETVAFIAGRKNILCAIFILLSFLSYMAYEANKRKVRLLVSALFFFIGLFSMEFIIVLPAIVIAGAVLRGTFRKKALYDLVPFFIAFLVYFVVRNNAIHGVVGPGLDAESLVVRLAGMTGILLTYIRLSLLPFNQKALYDVHLSLSAFTILYVVVLLLILFFLIQNGRRVWVSLSALWFFGFLFPVMNIVPLAGSPMAERYLYIPLLGFALFTGGFFDTVIKKSRYRRYLFSAYIGMLIVMTIMRIPVWQDDESLYRDMIRTTPTSYKGYYNLGNLMYQRGEDAQAEELWKKVVAIRPDMYAVHNNLGVLYEKAGNYLLAEHHYLMVLSVKPYAETYLNLGNVFVKLGKKDKAVEAYQKSIELSPQDLRAYVQLSVLHEREKAMEQALAVMFRAIRNIPGSFTAYNHVGTLLGRMGRIAEARQYFLRALELNPKCYECMYNVQMVNRMIRQSKSVEKK